MIKVEENKILYEEHGQLIGSLEFIFLKENEINIIHIYVNSEFRGKGIANKLMEYATDYFQNKNIIVTATCSYAKKYFIDLELKNEC